MDKVIGFNDAISKLKDKDSVIIGNLGNDGLADAVSKAIVDTQKKELSFVTVDPAVHACANFKEILASRTKSVITVPAGKSSVPANVACEISADAVLVERIRAGGAGIPAFFMISDESDTGKEKRTIDGKACVRETAISGDIVIIRAKKADLEGNCYLPVGPQKESNRYLPFAGKHVIAIADEVVSVGEIEPEYIAVPGILVEAVVKASSLQK